MTDPQDPIKPEEVTATPIVSEAPEDIGPKRAAIWTKLNYLEKLYGRAAVLDAMLDMGWIELGDSNPSPATVPIENENNPNLSKLIDELDFSDRAREALARMGCKTIKDISRKTRIEFFVAEFSHFGHQAHEVVEKMQKLGCSFALAPWRQADHDPALDMNLNDVSFSDSARINTMLHNKLHYLRHFVTVLGDLTELPESFLINQKGIGQSQINAIKSKLFMHGARLKDEPGSAPVIVSVCIP